MNTTVNTKTYTLQIPQADARLFSALVNLKSFKSIDELKDYLHS